MDFYTEQTYDFEETKGDTVYLKFSFIDKITGNPVDITGWDSKFTLLDPITDDPIATLQKIHDDGVSGGGGIYYFGDAEAPSGLGMTETNQVVVILSYAESGTLEPDVYPFDIELKNATAGTIDTVVHGNLIIVKEKTVSV